MNEKPPFPAWVREIASLAVLLASIVGLYFGLKGDQRSTHEEVSRLAKDLAAISDTVNKISERLPNREADALRFKTLEEKVDKNLADTSFAIAKLEKWKEDTTRFLIKKGVID